MSETSEPTYACAECQDRAYVIVESRSRFNVSPANPEGVGMAALPCTCDAGIMVFAGHWFTRIYRPERETGLRHKDPAAEELFLEHLRSDPTKAPRLQSAVDGLLETYNNRMRRKAAPVKVDPWD